MFLVENLETVEEYKEENKHQRCYHLTNRCKHFGAFPSEFSSLLLLRVTDMNTVGPIRKHELEKRVICGGKKICWKLCQGRGESKWRLGVSVGGPVGSDGVRGEHRGAAALTPSLSLPCGGPWGRTICLL